MALDSVWVLAEFGESGPTTLTQELLTEARAIGTNVSAVSWGPDAATHAAQRGHRPTIARIGKAHPSTNPVTAAPLWCSPNPVDQNMRRNKSPK